MGYLDNAGLTYFFSKIKSGLMSTAEKTKLSGIATGATKNTITQSTVTLLASNWSNKSQTLTVSGATSSNLVAAQVNDSIHKITCIAQGSNSLTFTCETTPTENITVKIAIIS